jgi:hypothetical protein
MASGNAATTATERSPARPAPGNGAVRSSRVAAVEPNGAATNGSAAAAQGLTATHREGGTGSVVDRSAAILGRTPSPFTPRQLARLDEALTLSSRETGLLFSVYIGQLEEPTREHAERLHQRLGPSAASAALIAVSPGQRVVHVVTGETSSRRLPDRSCALAVLSMEASFSVGDLVGGIVNGLRMLADQAGRKPPAGRWS